MEKVRSRGWEEDQVALLVGRGNGEVQLARREMIPMDDDADSDEDEGEGEDDGGADESEKGNNEGENDGGPDDSEEGNKNVEVRGW